MVQFIKSNVILLSKLNWGRRLLFTPFINFTKRNKNEHKMKSWWLAQRCNDGIGAAWAINERYNGDIRRKLLLTQTRVQEQLADGFFEKTLPMYSALRIRLFFTRCILKKSFWKGVSRLLKSIITKPFWERAKNRNGYRRIPGRTSRKWQLPILLP